MVFVMPKPFKIGNVYYFRLHVPRDVAQAARGKSIFITVGERKYRIKIGAIAKVSLRTSDAAEAKARHALALADAERFWSALRQGPKKLTHKQSLALAGEICGVFISAFDEDPGDPKMWERVLDSNSAALEGRSNPLRIPTSEVKLRDLEQRFGVFVDAALAQKGLNIDDPSKVQLLQNVAHALNEAAEVNLRKAMGDYSNPTGSGRYPKFEAPKSDKVQRDLSKAVTFENAIDQEVKRRAAGRDAKSLPKDTERKFRRVAEEFSRFRESDVINTLTAEEFAAWRDAMTDQAKLSNNTIKQKMQNVRTVVKWADEASYGKLFSGGNPIQEVRLPEANRAISEERTLRLSEAREILISARAENAPEKRWLPWMCAYSGARINEVAQLKPSDFFQVEGEWFYRLTTAGGRKLKNANSERRVPVHPALLDEGLMTFVKSRMQKPNDRLFPPRSQGNVAAWVRETVGIT
ncbi:hypothetical protein [Roseinatronobacter sp.]